MKTADSKHSRMVMRVSSTHRCNDRPNNNRPNNNTPLIQFGDDAGNPSSSISTSRTLTPAAGNPSSSIPTSRTLTPDAGRTVESPASLFDVYDSAGAVCFDADAAVTPLTPESPGLYADPFVGRSRFADPATFSSSARIPRCHYPLTPPGGNNAVATSDPKPVAAPRTSKKLKALPNSGRACGK